MSTTVAYSNSDACAECGAKGADVWVEVRHEEAGASTIGACLRCRTSSPPSPKPRPISISPSALDAANTCARKWAWQYIAGWKPPQNPAAALGEAVHGLLEEYLRSGATPPETTKEGRIALTALPYLPEPGERNVVEEKFRFDLDGVTWSGRLDLQYIAADGIYVVHDHKTSGAPLAKSMSLDLTTDAQATLYALRALLTHLEIDRVRATWLYIGTKEPGVYPLSAVLTGEQVASSFLGWAEFGRSLVALHTAKVDPLSLPLPTDASACRMYGGCPFRKECGRLL